MSYDGRRSYRNPNTHFFHRLSCPVGPLRVCPCLMSSWSVDASPQHSLTRGQVPTRRTLRSAPAASLQASWACSSLMRDKQGVEVVNRQAGLIDPFDGKETRKRHSGHVVKRSTSEVPSKALNVAAQSLVRAGSCQFLTLFAADTLLHVWLL